MAGEHHGIDGSVLVSKKESRRQFRRSILEAWSWRCAYCQRELQQQATLDHVVPLSRGGPTSRGNLVAACPHCNGDKSDQHLEVWFRQQSFYCQQREQLIWWWRLSQGLPPAAPPLTG